MQCRTSETGFQLLVSCVTKVMLHETIDLIPRYDKDKVRTLSFKQLQCLT